MLRGKASETPFWLSMERKVVHTVKVTSRFEVNSRNELNFWLPIKKQEWHDFFVSKMKDRNEVAVQRDVLGLLCAHFCHIGRSSIIDQLNN